MGLKCHVSVYLCFMSSLECCRVKSFVYTAKVVMQMLLEEDLDHDEICRDLRVQ